MNMKLSAGASAVLLALAVTSAHAADWSDTSISYRYGTSFTEPGINADVKKNIVALTHVSGFKYGQNFFNVDVLTSDKNDPAANSTNGAQEIYLVYANQLHLSKIAGSSFAMGPIRDFALTTGFDGSAKNTDFAPRVRKFLFGPTIKFGVGSNGWADLSLLYYKETNHNGIVGKDVNFDSTYRIAAAWGVPFELGPVPLSFNGFLNYTGAKGKNGFGGETKEELWTDIFLMLDAGKMVMNKPGTALVGVGYEFIQHKFGESEPTAGTKTNAPMVKVEWHF